MIIQNIDKGKPFDWGRTSEDYAKYRDIYPKEFYDYILNLGLCKDGQKVLDIGTGTGVLPRNMYKYGASWMGSDISENQIEQAKRIACEEGMDIEFFASKAEDISFADETFDVITACQCIWYLKHEVTAPNFAKMLKADGHFLILYMGWLPLEDKIAEKSEEIILKYNPTWNGCGDTVHPVLVPDDYLSYFKLTSQKEFRVDVPFSRESWHGRIRACRGVGASLSPEDLESWDKEHAKMLEENAPENFMVKHYVSIADLQILNKPHKSHLHNHGTEKCHDCQSHQPENRGHELLSFEHKKHENHKIHQHNHGTEKCHDCQSHQHESHNHQHSTCACGHSHGSFSKEEARKKRKTMILRISISVILLIGCFLIQKEFTFSPAVKLLMFLVPYFIVGYDILLGAVKNCFKGRIFDEHFLMALATIGAFALGEYAEAIFIMIFSQIGTMFEDYAVNKSRSSIEDLMNIKPEKANIEKNGQIVSVSPEEVKIGDVIIVKPGEKIPLDGVVIDGTSVIDTAALTGESLPRDVFVSCQVISGCINKTGVLKIKVEKLFKDSTVSKILELVQNATSKKTKTESFITRFAKWYTPAVVIGAFLFAILPPLFTNASFSECLHRSLIFLVISCPCALVISVPMGFFAGIGSASKKGILVKGSKYFETLANLKTAVFDKTGTLTKGIFSVSKIYSEKIPEEELLEIASLAESISNHPISTSIVNFYKKENVLDLSKIQNAQEIPGKGVKALVNGQEIYCGNESLMELSGAKIQKCQNYPTGTIVHISKNKEYLGYIVVSDQIKEQSARAINALKKAGVKNTVMLTGDKLEVAQTIAKELNIDQVKAELLPQNKVQIVEELIKNNGPVAFVGDGINDAPVLTRADVGIAMGALGSDAAIEAADVVLMDDNPEKIAQAILISRKTLKIVRQNIIFSLGVKFGVLILGVFGIALMWQALFADVGVLVLAVLNSMRAGLGKK